jgi:hypothetical protein
MAELHTNFLHQKMTIMPPLRAVIWTFNMLKKRKAALLKVLLAI